MKYLAILLLLTSCGSSYHLRKAERHLRLAKELGANITRDTIVFRDTIEFITAKVDTFFVDPILIDHHDTVTRTFVKDKVVIKYKRVSDTVYLSADCPDSVVYIEKKVPIETGISTGFAWYHLLAAFLAGAGLVALAGFLRR